MLKQYAVIIGFVPLGDEIDFRKAPLIQIKNVSTAYIPHRKNIDPARYAHLYTEQFISKKVCVFVPGQAFDVCGNRKGRGGGWYDRFFSHAPKEWLRVGVLNQHELQNEQMVTNSWDEPMDWLLIYDSDADVWFVHEVIPHRLP